MSIIANYLRLSLEDLEICREDQTYFEQAATGELENVHRASLDQAWDAMAWLISESARERAKCAHQLFLSMNGEFEGETTNPQMIRTDLLEEAVKGGREKLQPMMHFGYGPASVLKNSLVIKASQALNEITHDQLRKQFQPDKMQGVHPEGWPKAKPERVESLLAPFDDFREFFGQAAENRENVIVMFCD